MVNANTVHTESRDRHLNVQYSENEELIAQIKMLPDSDEVFTVVHQLGMEDLRAFAAAIMNATTDSARNGHADLDTIRLLNDWFASMEETIAAGEDIEEILSRRRKHRDSDPK